MTFQRGDIVRVLAIDAMDEEVGVCVEVIG